MRTSKHIKRILGREPGDPIRPCTGDDIWTDEQMEAEAERRLAKMRAPALVDEANISRFIREIEEHDCAMLTAFRSQMVDCVNAHECTKHVNTEEENFNRNSTLIAILYKKGYGLTAIDGNYIERYGQPDAKEVAENSFFVCNLKNDPSFIRTIQRMGEIFCQDSVFIKPRGATGYLLGTNHGYPGLGKRRHLPEFVGGKVPGPFLSRIRNRPFGFSVLENTGLMARGYLMDHLPRSKWAEELNRL